MSAEQFSKLSLGEEMVTTRAGAAKAEGTRSPSRQSSDQDVALPSIEPPSPASPTPSLVISTSNLQYNISKFGSDLRKRAKRGLQDNMIRMKYCAATESENSPGETKFFYLDDDITVAIGGKMERPKCTCGANEKGVACKHIYWVGDQILSTVPEAHHGGPMELSSDGSTVQDIKPADILEAKGLGIVAEGLDWSFRDEELPEDDEELRDSVFSMLSVFEPEGALPGEFECPESPLTSERSKVYRDVADLFTKACSQDPGLYIKTCKLIDSKFQNRVFFDKIESRTTQTFNGLDDYIATGSPNASPTAQKFDVKKCAKKLKSLVRNIDEYYRKQDEDDPETRNIAVRAASALVTILDRVTERDVNAYENITWTLERPTNPLDNNLFAALIGTSTEGGPMFVLDTLAVLPQGDLQRNNWEELQNIEEKLAASDTTPAAYINTFRSVVHETRKRRASEVREGDPKRAMQE